MFNHLIYDAFGKVTSETNPAVDSLFLFTARPFDTDTGLQNNLNRWYDSRVGRWLSEDPIGFAGGDGNLYRYVGNAALEASDAWGLWKIERDGNSQAKATSEHGDTLYALGTQIGLDPNEFEKWLTIPARLERIQLVTGDFVSRNDLQPQDRLCGGQTFGIPNVMISVWYGELKGVGKALVGWWEDNNTLRQLGFYVSVADMLPANTLLARVKAFAWAKELHGMFITGHGSETAFGTAGTSVWFSKAITVEYKDIDRRLPYKLGALVIHACEGDNPNARGLVSPNGIFYGVRGTFVPVWDAAEFAEYDPIEGQQRGLWSEGAQGTRRVPDSGPLLLP